MTLSIVVAMTEDRVIGRENTLPWHISEDLKRFKKITMGHPVVMGRKTYESLGRPLPGRRNIVLTRNSKSVWDGIEVVSSLEEAVKLAKEGDGGDEIFVIGGARVYASALPMADKVYFTLIHKKIKGDVFFPEMNWEKDFIVKREGTFSTEGKDPIPFSFNVAERKR